MKLKTGHALKELTFWFTFLTHLTIVELWGKVSMQQNFRTGNMEIALQSSKTPVAFTIRMNSVG